MHADDTAFPAADIGDRHPGNGAEPLAQQRREAIDASCDILQAQIERVIHGGAEAELRRVVIFPVLESARVRAQLVFFRRRPIGRMVIEKGRLQAIEKLPPQEKRQVLQVIDAFIERGQLKKKVQQVV